MGSIHLLTNEAIWQTLSECIKTAKHVDAAIAYFGDGGADLLRLRSGHRLVVDMSPATVKAGSTDPFEIEKLQGRHVTVFTRRNLHAKIVIADDTVIVGSANVSKNSRDNLDEVAIVTKDKLVLQRAREFIQRVCTEPVRDEYLNECKSIYRPPRNLGRRRSAGKHIQRATHAKLWIVNLKKYSVPGAESENLEQSERQARELIADTSRSKLNSFHWSYRPRMADELELGDWIIQCVTYKDKSIIVWPPGQLLYIDHYIRNVKTQKERYVFHLEVPKRGQTMSWTEFRKATAPVAGDKLRQPRTMPIRDVKIADELLRLWTLRGYVARR